MKTGAKQIISNAVIFFFLTSFTAFFSGCGGEADTVTPAAISVSASGTLTGTVYPRIVSVYPDGSTNPQVNTQIIIVFSKQINPLTIVDPNITITGGTPVTVLSGTTIANGYGVVLNLSVATLDYSTAYTVNITAAVQDIEGFNLSSAGSFNFTTAASTASAEQPRVISGTRFPIGAGVGKDLQYVEVTFTESVINVNTGTFTISGGTIASLSTSVVAGTNNKTWRLNLDTATIDYGQTYTVTLTNAIQTAGGAILVLDGNHTWNFQMETDPAIAAPTVNDIWVSAITDTTATIKFTTSKPVAQQDCYAIYDTNPGVTVADLHFQESLLATKTTLHTVVVTGLSRLTRYYFKAGIDTAGGPPVEIISVAEINFYTAANATVNTVLTNAVNNQDGLVLLQTNSTGSYAFWVSNQLGNLDIYGQYFSSLDGSIQWGAGGAALSSHGNSQDGIVAITDGFTEAVVIYKDSNVLYAKAVDSAGLKAGWGLVAGDQGAALGLTIKAGSSYSACIVHERPDIISSGQADMPDNGTPTNLLYDADVDFSIYNAWLDVNDLLVIDPGGTAWNNYTINNQTASPFDLFPYVLWTSGVTNLGAFTDYYIVDVDVTTAGTSDDGNTTTTLICSTGTNLLSIVAGDIILVGVEWAIATGSGWTVPYFWVSIDRAIAGLGVGSAFTIYTNHAGPFTSEAVTNPLWDTAPTTLFNPGTTVLAGDYVVNENNNTAIATGDAVAAIGVEDTDYALQLSAADIMNNGNIYSIVRLPAGFTYKAVGYSTSAVTDFNLTDGFNPFGAVTAGDIVFNIDQNLSAMVTVAVAGSLTLTADIFNGINQKAIIYTKRGFLVTYVDASDYIVARAFNIATGASLGAAFNVCTNGTNSNPVAVSDGAGNAIIFYEKGGGIYVKKVSAKGEFTWGAPADTSAAAGISVLAGYTIVQAFPDRSTGASSATGGAYLLAENGSGSFQLIHVRGSDGFVFSLSGVLTGYDPQMIVDNDSGTYNRAIIVYKAPHVVGVTYYHISAVAYRRGAGILWGPVNVSSNAVSYNCYQPSITMLDNTTAADGFYVSWFDARYYNPSGYTIYAQRYDATGTAQGSEIFVSMPASMGYDHALYMRLLYWNDGGTPYGLMPIWLDYRTNAATGTDIYYEQITAP